MINNKESIRIQCERLHQNRLRLLESLSSAEDSFPRSKLMRLFVNKGAMNLVRKLAGRVLSAPNMSLITAGWPIVNYCWQLFVSSKET